MEEDFSKRYGYQKKCNLIREDAPESIRIGLREVLEKIGLEEPSQHRHYICKALRIKPNDNNWSPYPINQEVDDIIHGLPWFKFYDLCERLNKLVRISNQGVLENYSTKFFSKYLNALFAEESIAYKMEEL